MGVATGSSGGTTSSGEKPCIYSLGHSTRSIVEFVSILRCFAVQIVVDIRSIPRSRHVPQFNSESLGESLAENAIRYLHLKELGGRRPRNKNSVNLGWHNASFQGYADYMQTRAFTEGIHRLLEVAQEGITATLCAEAVPWRCHRFLVADALLVRGVTVQHILNETSSRPHALTPFARVNGESITYPAERAAGELPFAEP